MNRIYSHYEGIQAGRWTLLLFMENNPIASIILKLYGSMMEGRLLDSRVPIELAKLLDSINVTNRIELNKFLKV
jgi:hypothetical protein